MTEKAKIRLAKLMALKGLCSRREAEDYIDKGLVEVDGQKVLKQGTKVNADADIKLLGKAKKRKVTILLNKPLGYVSNLPEKGYRAAIELIKKENQEKNKNGSDEEFFPAMKKKLAVAGRLDINSKGLLVLTQDGTIAKILIGSDTKIEKEYLVRVEGKITKEVIEKLKFGLSLDGKPLKKAKIDLLEEGLLRFVLNEGKKRQIRRMCEQVGLNVIGLKRVRIGKVRLGSLPEGKWRFLKADERF